MAVRRRLQTILVTFIALGLGLAQVPRLSRSQILMPFSLVNRELGLPRSWGMFAPTPARLVQISVIITGVDGKREMRKIYEEEDFARREFWWNWKISISRPNTPPAYLEDVARFAYRKFNSPERPIKRVELLKTITPARLPGKIVLEPPQTFLMKRVDFP